MRPIKLEMEAFTSFRELTSVDFSNLGLFAITGPTGAGKTSIIDAITYALYGYTCRVGEKQARELISQGKQKMTVMLEFSSNGKKYRATREARWKGKSLKTDARLDEAQNGQWVSRADSVTKVRPDVEEIIGLDFEGFTRSVILPQGRFDEFLKGKPDERRNILSDLLNLDVYSRMMKRANALAKENLSQINYIESQLKTDFADATPETIQALSTRMSDLHAQQSEAESKLLRWKEALPFALALRQDHEELEKTQKELKALPPREQEAERRMNTIRSRITDLQKQISDLEEQIRSNLYDPELLLKLTSQMGKLQTIAAVKAEVQSLETDLKTKQEESMKFSKEDKERKAAAKKATTEVETAEKDLQRTNAEVLRLRKLYGSPDAIQSEIENLHQLREQQKKLQEKESSLIQAKKKHSKLQNDMHKSQTELHAAEHLVTHAEERARKMEQDHQADLLRAKLTPGDSCPVCGQEVILLPQTSMPVSLEKAQQELESARKNFQRFEKEVMDLRLEIAKREHELKLEQQSINELSDRIRGMQLRYEGFSGRKLNKDSESLLATTKTEMENAVYNNESCAQVHAQKKEAELQANLALKQHENNKSFWDRELSGLQKQLEQKRKQSESLLSDVEQTNPETLRELLATQEKARQQRTSLDQSKEKLSAELSRAKDDLAPAQSAYDSVIGTRKTKEELIAALQERINENRQRLTEFVAEPGSPADLTSLIATKIRESESERNRLHTEAVRTEERLRNIEQKIKRAAELREKLETHGRTYHDANDLAQSLHGDEFIAFIQQEAYRRLAMDGSVHLKTLSSERYSLTVEDEDFYVIDHWNADERRPVNTLSGGESFLASLALALALAEGLSGISSGQTSSALESLFLDEGFGTLDPETLEVVVAGIEALSLNDRLIGIISHLPDLADRMLTRIVVRKSVTGSTLQLN